MHSVVEYIFNIKCMKTNSVLINLTGITEITIDNYNPVGFLI